MKVTYRDLLDRLGVTIALQPYGSQMWEHYEEKDGMRANACVLVENTIEEMKAELYFVHDKPQADKKNATTEVVCTIEAGVIQGMTNMYTVKHFHFQGKPFDRKVYDWEGKSCNFFRACVREIKAGRIPDVEMIASRELTGREVFGNGGAGSSEKSPRINTQQLLYDYKNPGGRGF